MSFNLAISYGDDFNGWGGWCDETNNTRFDIVQAETQDRFLELGNGKRYQVCILLLMYTRTSISMLCIPHLELLL